MSDAGNQRDTLTFKEWTKCLDLKGIYADLIGDLEASLMMESPVQLDWTEFQKYLDGQKRNEALK